MLLCCCCCCYYYYYCCCCCRCGCWSDQRVYPETSTEATLNSKTKFAGKFKICMPIFDVKEWKTHRVFKFGSHFQNIAWLSKLPNSGMRGLIEKICIICIWTLFLPQRVEIEGFFVLCGQRFPRYGLTSKLPYLGMKPGIWKKCRKLHMDHLSTTRSRNWAYFLLYGQQFPRYGPIFEIAIFGHETWNLKKVPEGAYEPSFYPKGLEVELIFALWAAVFEIGGFQVLINIIN